MKVWGFFN